LKTIWETAQSMSEYRGKTTLIFVPDHGRVDAPIEWKNHGKKTPRSEFIWMAFLGPDTPPLGERADVPNVTQSQVAATLAALLGEDYNAAVAQAGKPINAVLSSANLNFGLLASELLDFDHGAGGVQFDLADLAVGLLAANLKDLLAFDYFLASALELHVGQRLLRHFSQFRREFGHRDELICRSRM